MTTSEEEIKRSHELYLRHILLLGQAAPVCLMAIIEREVNKRDGNNLDQLIVQKKDAFKNHYNAEFLQLFQDEEVMTNTDSWDTRLLCVVILVLFKPLLTPTEHKAIACVIDQRKDLDSYAHSASLSYNDFKTKWDTLHSAVLTLGKSINQKARNECIRMIYSFELEPIRVNKELIKRIKQSKDANLHVQIAIEDKVAPNIHEKPVKIVEKLHVASTEVNITVNEDIVLSCLVDRHTYELVWRHNNINIEPDDRRHISVDELEHRLTIRNATLADAGDYTVDFGDATSSTRLIIKGSVKSNLLKTEKPVKIVESLHVATAEANVRVSEEIVLSCLVDRHTSEPVWRHNNIKIEPDDRRHISFDELEHRVTIRNSTLADAGDYTVDFGDATSSTRLIIKGSVKSSLCETEKPAKIVESVHVATAEANVRVTEEIVLSCLVDRHTYELVWRHNNINIEPDDRRHISVDELEHRLTIQNATLADAGDYTVDFGDATSSTRLIIKGSVKSNLLKTEKPVKIVESLHVATAEANVRVTEEIVLSCLVDRHTYELVWRHNNINIQPDDRRHISVDELEHRLTIQNATLADAGDYTVDFGDATSSTRLIIREKPVKIVESLHVATTEVNVRVSEEIGLSCLVDRHTNEPVWRHNDIKIESGDRILISVQELEHRLTIKNATLADAGDYTVDFGDAKSSTRLTLKEKPVKIIEKLHVASTEVNVRVSEEIVLSCLVDRFTNEPAWRHNNRKIEPDDRRHISVNELEHILTIRNASFEDEDDYTVAFGDVTSSTSLTLKDPVEFTNYLQDTFVNVGDSTILTCKLNVPERAVKWSHDYKPIQETDNIQLVRNKCTHWLAIHNTKLTDAGQYTCSCEDTSTTASLKVSDISLTITKDLHVATVDADIRENVNIVLKCAVNLHTNKAIWQHDGIAINTSNRLIISVQDLEHKLTIMNAKFGDEGKFTVDFGEVKTSAYLTLKGNLNLRHKKQLTEDLFRNWVRGALGLKYLKLGLEEFADKSVNSHHVDITKGLPGTLCTTCTAEFLLPSHKPENCPAKSKCKFCMQQKRRKRCPNGGFCSTLCECILKDHRFYDPLLSNTDVTNWNNSPWSVATCYINTTGYKGKLSAKEVDCSGLLSLFINNKFINRSLGDVKIDGKTDPFKQARDVRNDILHNANYELSEDQFNDCIKLFKSVLEIKNVNGDSPLSVQPSVQEAIDNLNKLQKHQIDIRMSEDFDKEIEDLKTRAMGELAEKMEEAEKQNRKKLENLALELKETEENLQLMRDLRLADMESKNSKEPFELELYIQALGLTGETSTGGKKRIYQSMTNYVSNQRRQAATKPTDESIYRLLDFITTIKDCKIAAVRETDAYAYVKIHCLTCKAIHKFLKIINGNEFRNETIELQKSLGKEADIKTYDIVVSCSSESIENTQKRLYKRVPTNDFSCGKHQGNQCTWYCSDHDTFCCSACKDSDHSTCVGIKQVVSESSSGLQKQSLTLKRKIGKYNVKIKNLLINRGDNDEDDCNISSICMLPDGNILLVDYGNWRLKKLDSSYNVVSHCDLPYIPCDVCYIGNDRAAVSLGHIGIQFVKVSGSMKLEQAVMLDHICYGLACHGDTLYVRDKDTIYTYNRDCQQKHVLYRSADLNTDYYFSGIAVSDDGERVYIACCETGLITIDKTRNHLFGLRYDEMKDCLDVCIVGDGTVLVSDLSGCMYQVDYSGKQILGTVSNQSTSLNGLPFCYDRQQCRLIGANDFIGDYITVFELKYHKSGAYKN